MGRRRNLTPEQRAQVAATLRDLRSDLGDLRALLEGSAARLEAHARREERRRARLRRLTFGLLGR